jgi:transposase
VGEASTIGLDIAKRVFQAHGADATGCAVPRRRLARGKVLEFPAAQPPRRVALEACGGGTCQRSRQTWRREAKAGFGLIRPVLMSDSWGIPVRLGW